MRARGCAWWLLFLLALPAAAQSPDDEVNVALQRWGASARASSVFGPGYDADNALDGRWQQRETDKWNSAAGVRPHWLAVDLGRPWRVHRVILRHEGVFAEGSLYNTAGFRIQRGESPAGPWRDLVPPIVGNTQDVTIHTFPPVVLRYLRIFITQAEQGRDEYGRLFEVEVYTRAAELRQPLFGLEPVSPPQYRSRNGRLEQLALIEAVAPSQTPGAPSHPHSWHAVLTLGRREQVDLGTWDLTEKRPIWVPAPDPPAPVRATLCLRAPDGRTARASRTLALPPAPYFRNGVVHLVPSSHQDIAWMDSPDRCIEGRDVHVITPALERLRANPLYAFSMEDTLCLMEYLQRHPERRDEIRALTRAGRLEWGATFNQPYESLLSGEALIRQVYFGRRWLRQALPGCDTHVAWNVDVPARAMQMPQVLSKAGIRYLVLSRHAPGLFRWASPDGSSVIAYSPGHYGAGAQPLQGGFAAAVAGLTTALSHWEPAYRQRRIPPAYCVLHSFDFSGPADYDALLHEWSAAVAARRQRPEEPGPLLPELRYSTAEAFLDQVASGNPRLHTIVGERPNVWLYIHGPTHHRAISAKRQAATLLPAAETFSTLAALVTGNQHPYPRETLDRAWQAAIYPDHGWGGYQGETTDRVFQEKLELARDLGAQVLDDALRAIAAQVQVDRSASPSAIPIVVFNSLSWERTDPVTCAVTLPPGQARGLRVTDLRGAPVASQIVSAERHADGSLKTAQVLFVASRVPPVGYRTYLVAPTPGEPAAPAPARAPASFENAFYRVLLAHGGINSLYDKTLRRELLRTDRFLGGELFTLRSEGTGAGEFDRVQQPTMEGFDRLSRYRPWWTCTERGPVRTAFELEQPMPHCRVHQRLLLYHEVKRIDLETDILGWDGTPYREFRLAFPIRALPAQVAYEVPLGVVEVGRSEIAGAAGERYRQPCKDVRPREVQRWIDASTQHFGVTLSPSVAVCDYVDPTGHPVPYPVLQPVLLASRRSCHPQGNWYLQAGDHHYRFSLTSHRGGWRNGWRAGVQASTPLFAVRAPQASAPPSLPPEASFLRITPANVVLSILKQSEEGDGVVLRCYEVEGRTARACFEWFTPVRAAWHTNLIEDPLQPVAPRGRRIRLRVGHHAVETLKFVPHAVPR